MNRISNYLLCFIFFFSCQELFAQRVLDVKPRGVNLGSSGLTFIRIYDIETCETITADTIPYLADEGIIRKAQFVDNFFDEAYVQIGFEKIQYWYRATNTVEDIYDFSSILGSTHAISDFILDRDKNKIYCTGLVSLTLDLSTNVVTEHFRYDYDIPFIEQSDKIFDDLEFYKDSIIGSIADQIYKINKLDLSDTKLLYEYPEKYASGSELFVHHFSCDSTLLMDSGTYTFPDNSSLFGNWVIDIENDTMIYHCNDIIRAESHNYWNDVNYPIDCILNIDLDDNNSTADDRDFYYSSPCDHSGLPISDIDIIIQHDDVIDSVVLSIVDPLPLQKLDAIQVGNIVVSNNLSTEITLINNGFASNEEFQSLIDQILYIDDALYRSGIITIEIQAYQNLNVGQVATAIIDIPQNDAFAGADINVDQCAEDATLDLVNILDENANSDGAFYESNGSITNQIDLTITGQYDIQYIVQVNGCSDTATIAITINPQTIVPILSDTIVCHTEGLSIDLSGYNFVSALWSDGESGVTRTIVSPGIYMVTVTGEAGCPASTSFSLSSTDPVINNMYSYQLCKGEYVIVGNDTFAVEGQVMDTMRSQQLCDSIINEYQLSYYPNQNILDEEVFTICEDEIVEIEFPEFSNIKVNSEPIDGVLVLTDKGKTYITGTDSNGCQQIDSVEIILIENPTVTIDEIELPESEVGMDIVPTYIGEISLYEWTDANGILDCTDCPYPSIIDRENSTLIIRIEDQFGCVDTATVRVRFDELEIYVPNVISISSAINNNKFFYAKSISDLAYELNIYDRWGGLIYQNKNLKANEPSSGWNPEKMNVVTGVYIYMIRYMDDDNVEYVKSGDVTLLR